ncbi:rCG52210, isoform CRA_b [Rattus norvegicus]|uniref:RCG52210, isoform CRA_b n=1 Tax=Rattus norvegicus TaxID=10116 RepID=A6K6Q3_RAT|nr:rCG52210, isoform CRA_b [Rattus norvegicus]
MGASACPKLYGHWGQAPVLDSGIFSTFFVVM